MAQKRDSHDITFEEFRTRLLALGPDGTLVTMIHVPARISVDGGNDRPFVYLDTSQMGLLYAPLIPEGNTSTKFAFSLVSARPVAFQLSNQVVEDAWFKTSSSPINSNEYDVTDEVTNAPTTFVAEPSRDDPNLFAIYVEGLTPRAYLNPNQGRNPQNPRVRSITAQQDLPNIPYVFQIHIP